MNIRILEVEPIIVEDDESREIHLILEVEFEQNGCRRFISYEIQNIEESKTVNIIKRIEEIIGN